MEFLFSFCTQNNDLKRGKNCLDPFISKSPKIRGQRSETSILEKLNLI